MLEAYSMNVAVPQGSAIPFNNVTIEKGCTARLQAPSTITLNKCGVYMVECDGSLAKVTSIQLYKDGVAQPQAQSTGNSPGFTTLVQVNHNNCGCCCSSPVTLQIKNTAGSEATFANVNVCVTKIC